MIRNLKVATKLWMMIIPAIIVMVITVFLLVYTTTITNEGALHDLYEELYISNSLILNADRDFYQAAVAEQDLIFGSDEFSEEELEGLYEEYQENAKQTEDRILEAIDNIRDSDEIYKEFVYEASGETLEAIEASFRNQYKNWYNSYNPLERSGNLELHQSSFNKARDEIDKMTELLESYALEKVASRSASVNRTNMIQGGVVVAVIILISLLAISIISYIKKNVVSIKSTMHNISEKDLSDSGNQNIKKSKDEFGDLNRSVENVVESLREIIGEINRSVHALKGSSSTLRKSTYEVNSSVSEISSTVGEMADGATQQAMDTMRVSEDVGMLGEVIIQNNQSANNLQQSSEMIGKISAEGLTVVNELNEVTQKNKIAFESIFAVIKATNESANKIGDASKLISDIAEQTNLLALNAAIEAARAGESGRGFAVVAEEIRKLAEQSTKSTDVIDKMLQELKDNVDEANKESELVKVAVEEQVQSVDETKEKYEVIVETIGSINDEIGILEDVSSQMESKRVSVMEVVDALSAIAEENAASTEETSAVTEQVSETVSGMNLISEEVDQLVDALTHLVEDFKLS